MIGKRLSFNNRAQFRTWLGKNHSKAAFVWIEYYKDGTPGINYRDSLEEALCFGWIDSIVKKIDERVYVRKFTPRRPRSRWSEINKRLVQELIDNGRMTEHGLAKVKASKANGTWKEKHSDNDDDEDKNIERLTKQFRRIIKSNRKMLELFEKKGGKTKQLYVSYYFDAKKEDTKKRRIKRIFEVLKGVRQIL